MKKLTIIFLLLIITSTTVSALGIAPALKEIYLGQKQFSYPIKIINNEKQETTYNIKKTGDLAEYITLSHENINFSKGETSKTITVKVNIPENKEFSGGKHTTRIIITRQNEAEQGIAVNLGVASKLILHAPYGDVDLKLQMIAPDFLQGKNSAFAIEATNLGTKTAKDCTGMIEIIGPTNLVIDTLYYEQKNILSQVTESFIFPWNAKTENGEYLAKGLIRCGTITKEIEKTFDVGTPDISIQKILIENFEKDSINELKMVVKNNWNHKMDNVYSIITVLQNNKVIETQTTPSIHMNGGESKIIPFYLDTRDIQPGEYETAIELHFNDEEKTDVYKITITDNDFVIHGLTGNLIKETKTEGDSSTSILIIIILLLVLVNGLIIIYALKKKS